MDIAIIGAGALGRLVADILLLNNQNNISFYDDNETRIGTKVDGIEVKGTIKDIYEQEVLPSLIIGIGGVETRKDLYDKFESDGFRFVNAIHPSANIASSAKIGTGVIIKQNAVVAIGATIGSNSVIGSGAILGHDCIIGKNCCIAPSVTIAGHSVIGEGCYLGVKVSVDNKLRIGNNSIVASGCTIWKDVPNDVIVKLPMPMYLKQR